MFTRIGNVVLWIVVIAGFIGSLILGIFVGTTAGNGFIGFLIVILGLIVTLIVNMIFGIIIEISKNVMRTANNTNRSRELLEKMVLGYVDDTLDNKEAKNKTWTCPNCGDKNKDYSIYCKCGTHKRASERKWYCSRCGQKNEMSETHCTVCGQKRLNDPEKINPMFKSIIWTCKECGEQNDMFSYTCKKCHRGKK